MRIKNCVFTGIAVAMLVSAGISAADAAVEIPSKAYVTNQVGTLSQLKTDAKDNTVEAINELVDSVADAKSDAADAKSAADEAKNAADDAAGAVDNKQEKLTGDNVIEDGTGNGVESVTAAEGTITVKKATFLTETDLNGYAKSEDLDGYLTADDLKDAAEITNITQNITEINQTLGDKQDKLEAGKGIVISDGSIAIDAGNGVKFEDNKLSVNLDGLSVTDTIEPATKEKRGVVQIGDNIDVSGNGTISVNLDGYAKTSDLDGYLTAGDLAEDDTITGIQDELGKKQDKLTSTNFKESGDGNAVTGVDVDGDGNVTLNKGATFLTEHQSLDGYLTADDLKENETISGITNNITNITKTLGDKQDALDNGDGIDIADGVISVKIGNGVAFNGEGELTVDLSDISVTDTIDDATKSSKGVVQIGNNIDVNGAGLISIKDASDANKGVAKMYDTVDGTNSDGSVTQAALNTKFADYVTNAALAEKGYLTDSDLEEALKDAGLVDEDGNAKMDDDTKAAIEKLTKAKCSGDSGLCVLSFNSNSNTLEWVNVTKPIE